MLPDKLKKKKFMKITVQVLADSLNWSHVTNEVKIIHSKLNIKHHTVHLKYIYNF